MSRRLPEPLTTIRYSIHEEASRWTISQESHYIPARTLQRWLKELVDLGILTRRGRGRATTYELSSAAREVLDRAMIEALPDMKKWSRWFVSWDDRASMHPAFEEAVLGMLQGEIRIRARELEKAEAYQPGGPPPRRSRFARRPSDDEKGPKPKPVYCQT